jgi:hypothetical protein
MRPVGVLKGQFHQYGQKGSVRPDPAGKDLGVFHLAGHDRLGDAGILEQADALAQLAQRDPVDGRARLRRRVVQIAERLFLRGDDGYVVAHRPGGVENQKRESPVAGDEA